MPDRRNRPPFVPKRIELIAMRRKKFPGLLAKDFAQMLGVTRLHMTNVEVGRRPPSLELALRWIELLGPGASMALFSDAPNLVARATHMRRTMQRLKKISPETYEAA